MRCNPFEKLQLSVIRWYHSRGHVQGCDLCLDASVHFSALIPTSLCKGPVNNGNRVEDAALEHN